MKSIQIKSILGLAVLLCSQASFANDDVIPENFQTGSTYVRVTLAANQSVNFEQCTSGQEAQTCTQLGPKASYTRQELTDQRSTEQWQVAGAAVADVGAAVAAFFGGAYAGGAIAASAATATDAGMAVGGTGLAGGLIGGIGVPATAVLIFNSLNPAEQYRQAEAISDDVIGDRQVDVQDMPAFIARLNLVLGKLSQ